jgi:hypothetical protein
MKEIRIYEKSCNLLVIKFCQKQGLTFEYWVADRVGEIVLCSDFFFNLSDIVFDLKTKQPKGKIIEWYDADSKMNYQTFLKLKN